MESTRQRRYGVALEWLPLDLDRGIGRNPLRTSPRRYCCRDVHGDHRSWITDPPLLDRLHEGRFRIPPLFRLPQPVHHIHADPGPRRQPVADVHRLGRRRTLLVPVDRILVRRGRQLCGRQEGFHHEPGGRLCIPAGNFPVSRSLRFSRHGDSHRCYSHLGSFCGDTVGTAAGFSERDLDDRPAAVHRSHWQERADPTLRVAPRCNGGADPGFRTDPRRYHGDLGSISLLPLDAAVRGSPRDPRHHRWDRRVYRTARSADRIWSK